MLQTYPIQHWDDYFTDSAQQNSIRQLEMGDILYFPNLMFSLTEEEKKFLSPSYAEPKSKNISYHAEQKKLWGVNKNISDVENQLLKKMLDRYAHCTYELIKGVLPRYMPQLILARTSFRPVQVSGRESSYRKDDTRLHIDA